jgi:hypothetical protein
VKRCRASGSQHRAGLGDGSVHPDLFVAAA